MAVSSEVFKVFSEYAKQMQAKAEAAYNQQYQEYKDQAEAHYQAKLAGPSMKYYGNPMYPWSSPYSSGTYKPASLLELYEVGA